MKSEDILKHKYGTAGGFKVPEGYFEQLSSKVMTELPPYPEAPVAERLSRWQRVKPYVYLAAMFAGIWCMMQMFHRISTSGELNLDNPPEQVMLAMSEVSSHDNHFWYSEESDMKLEDEVSSYYDNFDDFERDFSSEVDPE